jgi:site-specific recombinase XerD
LWLFGHLSGWLGERQLAPWELTPERAKQFLVDRRARGYKSWTSPRCLALPLGYLQDIGVVPLPAPAPNEDFGTLLDAYRRYLLFERGLVVKTVTAYIDHAELFLSAQSGHEVPGLKELGSAGVLEFVKDECARRSVASAQQVLSALRSLLRYLYLTGAVGSPLAAAVPVMARRRQWLPRGLEATQVARLVASCDRRRKVGRRDYAILMLLTRLGLRAGEVAALRLDDFDWHRGEVRIRGKGDRHEPMPLPVDVGQAVVDYLHRGRPRRGERSVFLRVRAPLKALSPRGVSAVVHDACVRAGLPPVGAHRLRHSAATAMLRAGSSLPEVASVLRHHRLASSVIYAKVDRTSLVVLARPWPGGAA